MATSPTQKRNNRWLHLLCFGLSAGTLSLLTACHSISGGTGREDGPSAAELRQLAERADQLVQEDTASLGREYVNRLRSEHHPDWLKYFQGKGPKPGKPTLAQEIKDLANSIKMIEAGPDWPDPGTFHIPYAKTPVVIDGKLDENAWESAATWTQTFPFNSTQPADVKTTWKVLWDQEFLYFAFDCVDTDVVAPARERDGHIYNDDCVEMFILPNIRFRTYWELIVAPNGSVYDSIQCKPVEKWGCIHDSGQTMTGMRHAQTVRGTINQSDDRDQGYTVEVAVPFAELPGFSRCPPKAGDQLHFMLVRLDRVNGEFRTYAFRPLQAWGHNIWNHAVMILKKQH
ncbi:MAG: carbohydrate-binding family 9-like protein [Candidatus Pacebacteria bacterium]|nr:carbohydrate-binding family 9-like protein [Candidatus Paceibacterota bacterium]